MNGVPICSQKGRTGRRRTKANFAKSVDNYRDKSTEQPAEQLSRPSLVGTGSCRKPLPQEPGDLCAPAEPRYGSTSRQPGAPVKLSSTKLADQIYPLVFSVNREKSLDTPQKALGILPFDGTHSMSQKRSVPASQQVI